MDQSRDSFAHRFKSDETGATAIEYALIAGAVSIVILTSVSLLGSSLRTIFQSLANAI